MSHFDINLLGDIEQKVTTTVKQPVEHTGLNKFFAKKSNLFIAISAGVSIVMFCLFLTIGITVSILAAMTDAEIKKTEQELDNMGIMLKKAQKEKKLAEQQRVNLIRKFEVFRHVEGNHFDWSTIAEDLRRNIPHDITISSIDSGATNTLYIYGNVSRNTPDPLKSIALFTLKLSALGQSSIIKEAYLNSYLESDTKKGTNSFKIFVQLREKREVAVPDFLQAYMTSDDKGKQKKSRK